MAKLLLLAFLLFQSYGEVAPKNYKNVRLDFRGMATRFPYYNLRAFPHKGFFDDTRDTLSCKKYRVKNSMVDKLYQRDFEQGNLSNLIGNPFDSLHYYSWQPMLGRLHILTIHNGIEGEYQTKIDCLIYDSTGRKTSEFTLAGGGGDGGYDWSSSGYFANDSTYKFTYNNTYQVCDTTRSQIITILKDGKLRKTKPKLVSYHHSELWGR